MHLPAGDAHNIIDVWSWNFDAEFGELLATLAACGDDAVLALDTEFPGFLREEPKSASRSVRYQALRENCDNLRPIQLGISVAGSDGIPFKTWSFNLCFDMAVDLHTEASVAFLSAAGLDFPRHAAEGIDPGRFGRRLAASPLVGRSGSRPRWITFQGWYDFGYLLRLVTAWPLPKDLKSFDAMLMAFFPQRYELRDELPRGSLDSLLREYGIERIGTPHTAGSDALATLELYLQVSGEGSTIVPVSEAATPSVAYSDCSVSYYDGSVQPDSVMQSIAALKSMEAEAMPSVVGAGHGFGLHGHGHHEFEWDEALVSGGWEEVHSLGHVEAGWDAMHSHAMMHHHVHPPQPYMPPQSLHIHQPQLQAPPPQMLPPAPIVQTSMPLMQSTMPMHSTILSSVPTPSYDSAHYAGHVAAAAPSYEHRELCGWGHHQHPQQHVSMTSTMMPHAPSPQYPPAGSCWGQTCPGPPSHWAGLGTVPVGNPNDVFSYSPFQQHYPELVHVPAG